jgi:predicted acyl esterase
MSAGRISKALIVAVIGVFVGMGVLTATAGAQLKNAPRTTEPATFTARGSIEELYVTDAEPGDSLMLVNSDNKILRNGVADSFGSKIFYYLTPGAEYTVRVKKDGKVYGTPKVRVRRMDANPKQSFYDNIDLQPGLNYVRMRDGVELAMTVRLPAGKTLANGPFPTFIEYSGYQVAAPNNLIDSVIGGGPSDPLAPASSTAVGSVIGPLLDFAVVSVQMRGSGCSGGGFDLFGLPTTYDGYDAVEAVAAQDWVKGGKVGMGGISFSGITQLFTAGTQPPHLAAISPLSVTDDVYLATGYPGGIFNSGFAYSWITERASDAEPAPAGGQPYARILSDPLSPSYDPKCAENQKLRLQTRDYNQLIEKNPYRTPSLFGVRSPGEWVSRIKVPTFLVGAYQDEQTGGHFVESLGRLKNNRNVWLSLQNGVHADSLGPSTITRWVEFMNLFVADRIPVVPPLVLALGGELYNFLADSAALPVEQSRFATYTSLAKAKSDFRKDPRVRLMMDNGAAIPASPGAIGASWELGFDSWPIREVRPLRYFIDANGKLRLFKPSKASRSAYVSDPDARPEQTITDGSEWAAQPNYNWAPLADGKGLGFTSAALTRDVVIAGTSSMDLYVRSSARDTDLQVTLTEVRPDGKETLVQSGWLRASHRKLARNSTALNPKPTHLKRDARNLPRGKFSLVRVPIFPVAHAFRKGSKIRVNIQAPGGDRQIWKFDTIEDGSTRNVIAGGVRFASKLVLPVIPGVKAKKPLPPPTALRGQPSRDFVPASNGG